MLQYKEWKCLIVTKADAYKKIDSHKSRSLRVYGFLLYKNVPGDRFVPGDRLVLFVFLFFYC